MSGPLDGVLVLDLSRALAGPHAAMMLGDLGARVIKVESPQGDDSRGWGPPFVGPEDARESTYFFSCNRNKESIALDLKDDADREVLRAMIARADVLLENFRSGVMDRLGFGVDALHALNPRLVVASITGFGHDGPEADRPGFDQIAQGEGGLMALTGDAEPTRVGVPIADLVAGMNIAYGVAAALAERASTGRGTVVRTSLLAGMVSVHAFQGTRWTVAGEEPARVGNHHASIAPYGLFRTATTPIQIACGTEGQWAELRGLLGIESVGWETNAQRASRRVELTEAIEAVLVAEPAEHWLERIDAVGIPCGQVRSVPEVYAWEQTRSQGLLIDVDHATVGSLTLPGPPLRFDGGEPVVHRAPPTLDQHGEQIRTEFSPR